MRYNPDGDLAMNRRQSERLKRLSDYLHTNGASRFMFEMLVPATPAQPDRFGGNKQDYDRELRPELMVRAIRELQDAGIEPDVWKIEGIDRREDCTDEDCIGRRPRRFDMKQVLIARLRAAGHEMAEFGAAASGRDYDYPD